MKEMAKGKSALVGAMIAATFVVSVVVNVTWAADWPQFRGIHRDGISAETGLKKAWTAAGPKLAFRREIGPGFSGVSVVAGRLYTMFAADHEGKPFEFAAALDPKTGAEIWRTPVGERFDNEFGDGPRSTPTVSGDVAYVLSSKGVLMALSTKDGASRWKVDLLESLKTKVPTFGYSGSVLVDGGTLFVEGGGPEGKAFTGVEAKTGKILWNLGDGATEAGYTSTLPIDVAGQRQYVHFISDKLRGIDITGKELWSHDWPQGETHAIPIFVPPNQIFASGAEGVGGSMLQIETGAGGSTVKELWKNANFRTHFNAAVVHDGHLYGFDNASLKCISLKDGSQAWIKRGLGKGSLILVDGMLMVLADDGRFLLVEATPAAYTEKGMTQALKGRCWTPPALSGGKIYLRNHTELVAYDLKG